jgi:uncharacterized protein involved in exopolysaccharide biosynthesis
MLITINLIYNELNRDRLRYTFDMSQADPNRNAGTSDKRIVITETSGPPAPLDRGIQDEMVEIWRIIWRERVLLCLSIAVCTAIATAYAFLAPQWYRSEALLVPASPKSTQNLAGQLGSLGGLVGLAGISIGGNGNTSEPLAVLRSRDFIRDFLRGNELLPVLFSDKWDAAAGRWKEPRIEDQPDLRDGVKLFLDKILTVQDDKKTGLVSVAVEWTNADQAAAWANQLIDLINQRMRDRAQTEAETNIEYLQGQLGTTSVATLKQAISRLLETELQKVMLARGNKEFAFRVVDRPEVAKHRSSPKRGLAVALGFLTGGIIGVLVVFTRGAFRGATASASRANR